MKKHLFILFCLFCASLGFSQEPMTLARFKEIVATPGDHAALPPKLAAVPWWTNSIATYAMAYTSGKVVTEEMTQTGRTVGGKYVVFSGYSKMYNQAENGILTYDEKSSTLKFYGTSGDDHGGEILTEARVEYDFGKKTFTINSTFGEFKEVTVGSYSDTDSTEQTQVYKNGVIFMKRRVETKAVTAPK